MVSEIPEQIARLRALPRSELLDLWQELYKKAAPQGVRREILIPFLAYKIQENACGGLKPKILAELHRITKALDRITFLETVAGVPGSIGATLRHLASLRRMKRDK